MRFWTLAQANAALPEVRGRLADLRRARAAVLEIDVHLKDLLIVHGGGVRSGGAGNEEWRQLAARRVEAHRRLHDAVAWFRGQGIEVKDLDRGLVDFWAQKGQDRVFLCWKEGEEQVATWHEIDAGYAGRQPVPDVPTA